MKKIHFDNTPSQRKNNTVEITKNNFSSTLKELTLIENKIQSNIIEITNKSQKLENLYLQQKDYKENFGIKETFHELEISLQQQNESKDNFVKQKKLLEEQNKLRFEFKVLREDIHSLNIEIKEISGLKYQLEDYKKQIEIVNLSIDQIQNSENKYQDDIFILKEKIIKHEEKIDLLSKEAGLISLPSLSKTLLNTYDIALREISTETDAVYHQLIEDLVLDLNQQQTKHKNAHKYKVKLEDKKSNIISTLKSLREKSKILHDKQYQLLEIEKIGQANNEQLAKIKDTTYDDVLYKSLLEQHKRIKSEYEKVLDLEKNIQEIPKIKNELIFLQDNEVKYTEKKIFISHQLERNY